MNTISKDEFNLLLKNATTTKTKLFSKLSVPATTE